MSVNNEGGKLLFTAHEWTGRVKDFRTIGRIFIHHATIPEFLNETFFSLNIGIGNIADFVRVEAIPRLARFHMNKPFRPNASFGKRDNGKRIDEIDKCISDASVNVKYGNILAFILKINAKVQKIICPRVCNINILHKHLLYINLLSRGVT
jgi:hypothetical protein